MIEKLKNKIFKNRTYKQDTNRILNNIEKKVNELYDSNIPTYRLFQLEEDEIKELKETIENQIKQINSLNGSKGGFQKQINKLLLENDKLKNNCETIENKNEHLTNEIKHLKDCAIKVEKQNELIQKLNDELAKAKQKPTPPTIQELERYELFHGKRNKK